MRLFKFLWSTHKWTGIILGIVFLNIAVTGFLLLIKKDYDWIQPPTQKGSQGATDSFVSLDVVLASVMAENLPDYKNGWADIDRIDFRPGNRVHKVKSKHNYAEVQVCAVTGKVLRVDWRPSDLIERLHDGSFFAEWLHGWLMPLVAVSLAFLVFSGMYMWLWPVMQKRRRNRPAQVLYKG